jgi:hypothetical protein
MAEDADVRNAKDAVARLRAYEQRVESHPDAAVRLGTTEIRVVREWILAHELDTLEDREGSLTEIKRLHERIDRKLDKAGAYWIGSSLTTLVLAIAAAVIIKVLGA